MTSRQDGHAELWQLLQKHQGKERAVTLTALADHLGVSTRMVQLWKRALVDGGYLIGSSCEPGRSGYYIPETVQEIRDTVAQYEARLVSLAKLIRASKGKREVLALLGQLSLECAE